jgi:hypothetical protein
MHMTKWVTSGSFIIKAGVGYTEKVAVAHVLFLCIIMCIQTFDWPFSLFRNLSIYG